jgi:hypothetical protein
LPLAKSEVDAAADVCVGAKHDPKRRSKAIIFAREGTFASFSRIGQKLGFLSDASVEHSLSPCGRDLG